MFARVIAVALVAVATLVNGIANGTGLARGPGESPMTVGASCPAQVCGCMPKLCTDLAIVSGTAMQLTYLCPEVKTVEVTETIWVTIHDHGSVTAIASTTVGEKTTTLTDTRKSTLYVTKTVKSTMHHIHDSSSMTAAASTTVDEKTTTVTDTRKSTLYVTKTIQSKHSSATGVTITSVAVPGPGYTTITASDVTHVTVGNSTVANATHPVSTRSSTVCSTDLVSILPVSTESAHGSFIITNPLHSSLSSLSSLSWSYIWRTTTTGVVAKPTSSSEQGSKVISSSSGTAVPSTVGLTSSSGYGYSTSSLSHANISTSSHVLPPPAHSKSSSPLITNMESFPTIGEPTGFISLPPDSEIFTSIFDGATDDYTDAPETFTDGIYFSSELPMYPTALARRDHLDNHTYAGTISMIITTTTVTVQEAASAITSIETQQVTTTETHASFPPGNERVSQGNAVDAASDYYLYLLPILFLIFLAL